jgi:hypothetical protein
MYPPVKEAPSLLDLTDDSLKRASTAWRRRDDNSNNNQQVQQQADDEIVTTEIVKPPLRSLKIMQQLHYQRYGEAFVSIFPRVLIHESIATKYGIVITQRCTRVYYW